MRRVLVTGSTGYIGQHLVQRLLQQAGNEVYGFNRTYDMNLPAHRCFEGNLLTADLLGWLGEVRPEVVFHAIGTSPKAPFEHQLLVQAEGTRRLLQALLDNGLRPQVVIVGSSAEYGLRPGALDEEAPCLPEGEYGIAKLAQTQIAQSFARRYDLPVVVGRVFNVYGQTLRHLAVASIASQIAQAEAVSPLPAELHVFNLRSWRDFVHIDDVVSALMALSTLTARPESRGQVYNIASGASTAISTVLELLIAQSRLTQAQLKQVSLQLHGAQQEDFSQGDITKIQQHTDWRPQVPLSDGLRRELYHWRVNVGDLGSLALSGARR